MSRIPTILRSRLSATPPEPTLAEQYGTVSRWRLEEATGARVDEFGLFDFTAVNSPGNVTGVEGNALLLSAAANQYLECADAPNMPGGNVDQWVTLWGSLGFLPAGTDFTILSKYGADGQRTLAVMVQETSNDLFIRATSDGSTHTVLAHGTAIAATTAFFCMVYVSSVDNILAVSLNGGAFVTTAHAGGLFDSTAPLRIGRRGDNFDQLDGWVDEVNYGRSPLEGITSKANAVRDYLYGGGTPPADPWG